MTTKEQGSIGEAFVLAELQSCNIRVSLPFTDNAPYDMIADVNGRLLRMQVKTSTVSTDEYVVFQLSRTRVNRNRNVIKAYTEDEIDLYALYDMVDKKIYYMFLDEAPRRTVTLRKTRCKNNNKKNNRFAEEFTLRKLFSKK